MATFSEIFSQQGFDKLMGDPRLQLGLQLLAASGPQPTDMSTGQRLAQAGMGFMQQRAQTQQQQQLEAYRQAQMEAVQQAAQARQADAARQAEFQKRMQDPAFLQQLGPLGRAMAGLGVEPQQLMSAIGADNLQQQRAEQLDLQQQQLQLQQQRFDAAQARSGQGGAGKAPTPRQIIDEPLANGMVQRHKYNAKTGGYDPFGAPFSRGSAKSGGTLEEILGGIPTDNQTMPDTNAGAGAAVPGLPGTTSLAQQAAGIAASIPSPLMTGAGSARAKQAVPTAAEANAPATPRTKEEYDALPIGAVYIDPKTGGVFTKKARG